MSDHPLVFSGIIFRLRERSRTMLHMSMSVQDIHNVIQKIVEQSRNFVRQQLLTGMGACSKYLFCFCYTRTYHDFQLSQNMKIKFYLIWQLFCKRTLLCTCIARLFYFILLFFKGVSNFTNNLLCWKSLIILRFALFHLYSNVQQFTVVEKQAPYISFGKWVGRSSLEWHIQPFAQLSILCMWVKNLSIVKLKMSLVFSLF